MSDERRITPRVRFSKAGDSDIYPDSYEIEFRQQGRAWMQRHRWYWDDGRSDIEPWILSIGQPPSHAQQVIR